MNNSVHMQKINSIENLSCQINDFTMAENIREGFHIIVQVVVDVFKYKNNALFTWQAWTLTNV